jgi:Flp pilus assembly protein TadD
MQTVISGPREEGIQALREGNLDSAIELLRRAVALDEEDSSAQVYLGMACSQKGLHEPARAALQAAANLQPRNPGYRYNLGVALEKLGDARAAAAAYSDALRLDPQFAQARAALQALGLPVRSGLGAARPPVAAAVSSKSMTAPWLNEAFGAATSAADGREPCLATGAQAIVGMSAGEAFCRRFRRTAH